MGKQIISTKINKLYEFADSVKSLSNEKLKLIKWTFFFSQIRHLLESNEIYRLDSM